MQGKQGKEAIVWNLPDLLYFIEIYIVQMHQLHDYYFMVLSTGPTKLKSPIRIFKNFDLLVTKFCTNILDKILRAKTSFVTQPKFCIFCLEGANVMNYRNSNGFIVH